MRLLLHRLQYTHTSGQNRWCRPGSGDCGQTTGAYSRAYWFPHGGCCWTKERKWVINLHVQLYTVIIHYQLLAALVLATKNCKLWWHLHIYFAEQCDWCDNVPICLYNYAPVLPVNMSRPQGYRARTKNVVSGDMTRPNPGYVGGECFRPLDLDMQSAGHLH